MENKMPYDINYGDYSIINTKDTVKSYSIEERVKYLLNSNNRLNKIPDNISIYIDLIWRDLQIKNKKKRHGRE